MQGDFIYSILSIIRDDLNIKLNRRSSHMKKSLKLASVLGLSLLLVACGEASAPADTPAETETTEVVEDVEEVEEEETVDEVRPDDDLTEEEKALLGE